jgi:hypothetical protein
MASSSATATPDLRDMYSKYPTADAELHVLNRFGTKGGAEVASADLIRARRKPVERGSRRPVLWAIRRRKTDQRVPHARRWEALRWISGPLPGPMPLRASCRGKLGAPPCGPEVRLLGCRAYHQGSPSMASQYGIERDRGAEESWQQIARCRRDGRLRSRPSRVASARWRSAPPGEIAAAMGWSLPYELGVLGRWKMAPVYCRAVLSNDQRIALDGRTGRRRGKKLATRQLARLARKATKKATKPKSPPLPRRPNRRSHCATGYRPRSCGGAHKSRLFVTAILNRRVCSKR